MDIATVDALEKREREKKKEMNQSQNKEHYNDVIKRND